MKKLISFIVILSVITAFALTGCTAKNTDNLEKQLKSYQEENNSLKQQNAELNQFKDRVSLSLSKIEDTLFALKSEGYLPFAGTQVNAPQLISAIKDIRLIGVEIGQDELVLSMQPREWSPDFDIILIVYDVYKLSGDMTQDKAGTITTMAGIFKKTDDKWKLVKFTKEYKGDESFSLKNIS